jgi:Xaa-Pro aminopeptidase
MNMRINDLPKSEYNLRVKKLQKKLEENNLDALICYSSECESGIVRYFTGFWPFFDFASLLIPREGDAVLVTGGPESLDFATEFAKTSDIRISPLLVETSAPEWIREVSEENFSGIISDTLTGTTKKVGISNMNIFPKILFEDIKSALPDTEFVTADELVWEVQAIKSKVETPYIVESYRIAEEALKAALNSVETGITEWEIEAIARSKMLSLGAEGMPYPSWVCSGKNTKLSLCRSTSKKIEKNELIQCSFGAKYMGYCANIGRALSIGKPSEKVSKLMDAGLEGLFYTLDKIRPGVKANDIFEGFYKILSKYDLEKFALYGPAHGTGHSEVEGLWLSRNADFIIQPGMLFNIDIWLSDGINGLRYEDGVLVTEKGLKQLTSYRREKIIL